MRHLLPLLVAATALLGCGAQPTPVKPQPAPAPADPSAGEREPAEKDRSSEKDADRSGRGGDQSGKGGEKGGAPPGAKDPRRQQALGKCKAERARDAAAFRRKYGPKPKKRCVERALG